MEQSVILCGLGRVGGRVLEYLLAAGLRVVVIEQQDRASDPRLKEVRFIRGDCRQREVLEQAGVSTARGVLILTSDDLVNISTTLMVRHLNPGVRIVVRLFNQNLIPRLGSAVPNTFALSVSALTAPLLALTALSGEALGAFALDDGRRQVADVRVGDHSPLRGRTIAEVAERHHVLVLAHLQSFAEDRFLLDVKPEARLAVGDHLVVCGEPRGLAPLLSDTKDELLPGVRWAGWLRRQVRMLRRTLNEIDLLVKVCTALLLVVVLGSATVYRLGIITAENKSFADALYRTISVMATGADMHEEELQEPWQKVFVSTLRLAGAALVAAFTALLTNYLLRARLGGALEVRRIPDSGHVVVCGLGNVGFRVVEELLRHGERVVVIELSRDSRFLATARQLGVAVIVGDATVLEVLRQAHVGSARAVVAATDNELANLEIALLARELNPRQRVVVRLSDSHLAQTLREAANVRLALSIPSLAAPAFMAALFGDRVQNVFLVGGRLLAVVELVVQPDDPFLRGQSVGALAIDYRLLPVSLARGARTVLKATGRLEAGDRLLAIAALPDLERLLRREKVPTGWAVEVSAFPLPARAIVAQVVRLQRGLGAEEAEKVLEQLPACVGDDLTRGQAEELLEQLNRERVTARLLPPAAAGPTLAAMQGAGRTSTAPR
jgi:Trk K+ transport system NAD-binding subunit